MTKASEYHKTAQWQEKLRALQEAPAICEEAGFPDAARRTQQVLVELGGVRQRFGQYEAATETLERALGAFEHVSPMARAKILGELGVVYRHSNEFSKARKVFNAQYNVVRETALDAEAELCRAIGNEGMSTYNLSQQSQPHDADILHTATDQLQERIRRAREVHQRLLREKPRSRYVDLSKSWETIGMDRLTLCYIAGGNTSETVRLAEESRRSQTSNDPTISAFPCFFYGNALRSNGQQNEALNQWSAPTGICTPAMALTKSHPQTMQGSSGCLRELALTLIRMMNRVSVH